MGPLYLYSQQSVPCQSLCKSVGRMHPCRRPWREVDHLVHRAAIQLALFPSSSAAAAAQGIPCPPPWPITCPQSHPLHQLLLWALGSRATNLAQLARGPRLRVLGLDVTHLRSTSVYLLALSAALIPKQTHDCPSYFYHAQPPTPKDTRLCTAALSLDPFKTTLSTTIHILADAATFSI